MNFNRLLCNLLINFNINKGIISRDFYAKYLIYSYSYFHAYQLACKGYELVLGLHA